MACRFDELQIPAIRHFKYVDEKRGHKYLMAWILITPAISVSVRDTHWKRASRDENHGCAVFAHQ